MFATIVCLILHSELLAYYRLSRSQDRINNKTFLLTRSKDKFDILFFKRTIHSVQDTPFTVKIIPANYDNLIQSRDAIVTRLEEAEGRFLRQAIRSSCDRDEHLGWRLRSRPKIKVRSSSGGITKLFGKCFGLKVDAIQYFRIELLACVAELENCGIQESARAAIVVFDHDISPAIIVPSPWSLRFLPARGDIIRSNIYNTPMSISVRFYCTHAFTLVFICIMSLPIGLSQIMYLSDAIAWLQDLHTMPVSIIVMLQNTIIPAVAISMVSALVPRSLRYLATLRGFASQRQMEESIQRS